tara:strand:- start:393 stop:3857 length:3465 start_codon:yes stop_codon:yes gene_type:complete
MGEPRSKLLKLSYEKIYDMYEKSSDKQEKELLKSIVEEKAENDNLKDLDYQPYPENNDKDFQKIIYQKQEFNSNQLTLETGAEDSCISDFTIKGHQTFLKNFMTKESPYKSILIYHGVGVGKTCSGVSIAENFRDPYSRKDRRIIVLSSKNIKIGWKNTIFSPEKGIDQCTGDTFKQNESTSDREVNKLIKQYYELMGYQSFSNYVRKLITKEQLRLPKEEKQFAAERLIKKMFSNRLLIIDEAHNIRDEQTNELKMRDVVKTIELVIKYSDNLRLILLTATPMYNRSSEIVWLLNMMLMNDNRPLLNKRDIFDSMGEITEEGKHIIQEKCRSYVSYLRGENPITFPLRIYPSMAGFPNYSKSEDICVLRDNFYPKKNLVGGQIKDKFQFLELFGSRLQGHQDNIYKRHIQDLIESNPDMDLDIRGEKTSITDIISSMQLSNIIYPNISSTKQKDITIEQLVGEKGLSKCMNRRGNKYSYKAETLKSHGPIFDIDHIQKYSSKIYAFLKVLENTEGIVFIYTNFIASGITPLCLALEQNGYKRFRGGPMLQYPKKRPQIKINTTHNASYMVIDGTTSKKDLEEQLKIVNSKGNINGEKIKIILGTVVASEGLDFKRIRSIHILDPWVHLNRLEQTIGRGIRFCSHSDLPNKDKNVLIFLHVGILTDNKECIDTHIYRYAERKARQIGYVEDVLKRVAVDRYLYKDVNIIRKGDIHSVKVKPCLISSSEITINPYDKPNSKVCSWLRCDYNYDMKPLKVTALNSDTYFSKYSSGLIQNIKKKIAKLYTYSIVYDLDSILGLIYEKGYSIDDLVFQALNEMISERYILHDRYGNSGYIINKGSRINKHSYYIFQPFLIDDETIPLYYRMNLYEIPKKVVKLPRVIRTKKECECPETFDDTYIISIYENISHTITRISEKIFNLFKRNNINITKESLILYEHIFDTLSFNEKCAIIYGYFTNSYSLDDYQLHEIYNTIVSRFVIYKDGDNYYINDFSTKGTKYGFVLSFNGEPCFFEYYKDEEKIIKCNSVKITQINNSLSEYKQTSHYKQFCKMSSIWGYTSYSKRHKGSVFKIVTKESNIKYPPGPGNICIENNQDVSKQNISRILEGFTIDKQDITDIVKGKRNEKELLCIILELLLRHKNLYYSYDKIWLKYY